MKTKVTEDGEVVDIVTDEVIARTPPFFKTPWNHDTDQEAAKSACCCRDSSKTQLQFQSDADINNILAQFLKTRDPALLGVGNPIYRDIMEEFDLQSTMVTSHEVQVAWEALSPEVRNTLKDPKTFADYVDHCVQVGDLSNLQALGLAPKPKEEPVATTSPPAGTPAAGAKTASGEAVKAP